MSAGLELLNRYGLQPKRPEVIDSSMLGDFMACPSMFYLRHVLGLRGKQKEVHLSWGTCWHETMYAFIKTWDQTGSKEEAIMAGLQAIEEKYPEWLTPEVDRLKRSKRRMVEQFFFYAEKWITQQASDFEILRHEQYFNVYFEDVDLRWCGRIDSLRRALIQNKIRVWDYKTTGSMGDSYFDQFEVSFQFPGYVASAQLLFTEDVREITIDVMYTISKSFQFFQRTFRYDDARILEWKMNTKRIVDRINRELDENLEDITAWEKNWARCHQHYGRCQFWPVHSLNPRGDGRLLDLRDNYTEDRWDPADIDEGD